MEKFLTLLAKSGESNFFLCEEWMRKYIGVLKIWYTLFLKPLIAFMEYDHAGRVNYFQQSKSNYLELLNIWLQALTYCDFILFPIKIQYRVDIFIKNIANLIEVKALTGYRRPIISASPRDNCSAFWSSNEGTNCHKRCSIPTDFEMWRSQSLDLVGFNSSYTCSWWCNLI